MQPPAKRRKQNDGVVSPVASRTGHGEADADPEDSDAVGWSDPDTEGLADYDSDELRRRRPNRWRGDRRIWLDRTQAEQLALAAMHGVRARDLAAHLYNTHALKQRAAGAERQERREWEGLSLVEEGQRVDREDSLARIRRDIKRELSTDIDSEAGWDSDDDYGHGYGYDHGGGDGDGDNNSIKAHSTTSANGPGGHRARTWAPQTLWTAWPLRMHERLFQARPGNDGDDDNRDNGDNDETAVTAATPPSHLLVDVLTATVLRLAKVRFRRRQRQWRLHRQTRRIRQRGGGGRHKKDKQQTKTGTKARRGQPPVVSADDELSAQILRPSVRHLLTQVDRLLTVLHNVRAGTAGRAGEDAQEEQQKKSHTGSNRWWRLRDWSDVVGAAALAGFDRPVLARTAQRCADLFGQSMVLADVGEHAGDDGLTPLAVAHTVYAPRPEAQRATHLWSDAVLAADEGPSPAAAAAVAVPSYSGQLGPRPPLSTPCRAGNEQHTSMEDTDDLAVWRQRTQRHYQAWHRQRRQRLLQQLQQQPETKTKTFTPGVMLPLWRCRHVTCDRSAVGFERRSNLTRHLKLVHGE